MARYIVIPARYQSSRLPGKPLLDIAGKPMIQHVYERAMEAKSDGVIIATDDEKIANCASEFGAKVCLTSKLHQSGTERISEVIDKLNFLDDDIVINIQGDEPLIPSAIINQVAENLQQRKTLKMATLCEPIKTVEELFDLNINKVTMDAEGYAIYFSHAPIPWCRDEFSKVKKKLPEDFIYYRHIGIYAYRTGFVKQYVKWGSSPLEKIEVLEQLRVLWHGERIHVAVAKESPGPGIDTKTDLELIRSEYKNK
jgi:3-deoxy-manno-octulosonate cytidylyltransferase (CMP-KDO synthetase)